MFSEKFFAFIFPFHSSDHRVRIQLKRLIWHECYFRILTSPPGFSIIKRHTHTHAPHHSRRTSSSERLSGAIKLDRIIRYTQTHNWVLQYSEITTFLFFVWLLPTAIKRIDISLKSSYSIPIWDPLPLFFSDIHSMDSFQRYNNNNLFLSTHSENTKEQQAEDSEPYDDAISPVFF